MSLVNHLSHWRNTLLGHSVLSILLGALAVMGFAPHNIPETVILSIMGLMGLLHQTERWKYAAWLGFAYGFGLFGLGVNWLGISLTVYGGVPFGFGWLMLLVFVFVLSLFPAMFAAAVVYLKQNIPLWMWAIFLVPTVWTLTEWLRVILWDGFPWLLFSYSHTDTWLVSWVQLGGNLALTFVVMVSAGILWWMWVAEKWLVGVAAFVSLWVVSWQLSTIEWVSIGAKTTPIALVHGQMSESVKWQPIAQDAMIESYAQATHNALDQYPEAKLIVWPETAIPTFIDTVQPNLLAIQKLANAKAVTVLSGVAIREDEFDGRRYYNSIATLTGDVHYDKRHLVPFSEYYPGFSLLNYLSRMIGMPMAQFSAGKSARTMALLDDKVGLGICYEVDFLNELAMVNPSVDWWLIVSDDGWFYPSWMADQHWQMVRLHAMALGKDIARVTNLGITGIAQADGQMQLGALPSDDLGARMLQVHHYQGQTPYSKWQDTPMLGLLSFMLALLVMRHNRIKKIGKSRQYDGR